MPNPLARKTIAEIESALEDDRSTAITEIIQLIQQMAAKAFSLSIEELAQLIGRDPTITEKVVSSANTLGFNPTGGSISTLSEAIRTIGFEEVRNLAISLMLAENAGAGANSYEQRQAAALCACSGVLAEQLSQAESERLFVCASLRNYGQLLLSTFLLERYRLARAHALAMPEDEAFETVFGLTPLRLGERILCKTNLPRDITYAFKPVEADALKQPAETPEDENHLLAELAGALCSVLFDERVGPEQFNKAIAAAIAPYARCYPLSIDTVLAALQQARDRISILNRAVGISEENSPAARKLQARLNGEALPEPPLFARILPLPAKKTIEEMSPEERKRHSDTTFGPALATIDSFLKAGGKVKLATVFDAVCSAFVEAARLDNCLVFVWEEYEPEHLSARYGAGALFAKVKNRPLLAAEKNDIFSICLNRREDILILDKDAGNIGKIVPEWMHAAGETSSFIILPVKCEKRLQALLVGAVCQGRQIDLSEDDLKHLRSLRGKISQLYAMIEAKQVQAV